VLRAGQCVEAEFVATQAQDPVFHDHLREEQETHKMEAKDVARFAAYEANIRRFREKLAAKSGQTSTE
jgi:hypothetical protein